MKPIATQHKHEPTPPTPTVLSAPSHVHVVPRAPHTSQLLVGWTPLFFRMWPLLQVTTTFARFFLNIFLPSASAPGMRERIVDASSGSWHHSSPALEP